MENLNKKENIKKFNLTIKTFFRSLIEVYPTVPAFKLMLAAYKTLKTFGKSLPAEYFVKIMAPYADQILNRDDSFVSSLQVPDDMSFVLKAIVPDLTGLWMSAPQDTRNAVNDYMCALVVLSKSIIDNTQ
jgi:hypothetical protein